MSDVLNEGLICLRHGRYDEAVRHFEAAVRDGGGVKARALLEKAKRVQAMAANEGPREGAAVRGERLAFESAFSAGDYAAMFEAAERFMKTDPGAAFRAVRDVWLRGKAPGLVEAPASPWKAFFSAAVRWNDGKDAEALTALTAAKASAPWMGYYSAEIFLRRLDRYPEALAEIEKACRAAPWMWEGRCLRAEILAGLGRRDEALADLAGVEVEEPRSRLAFLAWRGAQKTWSGRCQEALRDLDEAAAGDNHDAFCWRGAARTRLGRFAEALDDLDRVLGIDPSDPEARIWRGEARRLAGDAAGARADLDAALERSGDNMNPWARANRALLRLDAGDEAGAREDFTRVFHDEERAPDAGVSAAAVRSTLGALFDAAGGTRRQDPHLNRAWMLEAGVRPPLGIDPGDLFAHWLRARDGA